MNKDLITNYYNKVILHFKMNGRYNAEYDIGHTTILKLIKEILDLEYQEEKEFLIGDNKILMNLNLESQISLIVGNYIDNYFETDILFVFDDKNYLYGEAYIIKDGKIEKINEDGKVKIMK